MRKTSKYIIVFVILALVTFASLMVYAYFRDTNKPQGGDEQPGGTSEDEKTEGSATASFEYSGSANVDLATRKVTLYFKNAKKAIKDVSLELVADVNGQSVSLAEAGIMKPGDETRELDLKTDVNLAKGKYSGKFVLHFYNGAGEKEIVKSNIKIDVIVK